MNSAHPFILIVGPTASGKSALGLQLADAFKGAILNCDSVQTYRRLDIGTAKPTPAEMAKVPHLLFDVLDPGGVLTAGDFRKLALAELERELKQRPVFGVGGSGFYIQALEKGMYDVDKPAPEVERAVRDEVARLGLKWAHAELCRLDPQSGEDINPNDAYRITRALVMMRESGKTVSELKSGFKAMPFPYPLLKLGLKPSREQLLPRVERRVQEMFQRGFLDEVRALVNEGFADWPALQSVGYKECLMHLRGEVAYGDLLPLVVEKTMQLAKKQRTWFRRDPQIHWLDSNAPLPEALKKVSEFLSQA